MSVTKYVTSADTPYIIPSNHPIILRVACAAGVNRSATMRQYLISKIHSDSIVLPQYGAYYGDYERNPIQSFDIDEPDGFNDLFGLAKTQNIQSKIFEQLGYPKVANHVANNMDMSNNSHVEFYKNQLISYWNLETIAKTNYKNIFILVNHHQNCQDIAFKRLSDANVAVDYVIVPVDDFINRPINPDMNPHSKEAYEEFYNMIIKHVVVSS